MNSLFQQIKGDKLIWAIATLLAIFSFLPVYRPQVIWHIIPVALEIPFPFF